MVARRNWVGAAAIVAVGALLRWWWMTSAPLFSRIADVPLAWGLAAAAALLASGLEAERGRAALGLASGIALASGSLPGFEALWEVVIWTWRTAAATTGSPSLFAISMRLDVPMALIWSDGRVHVALWLAVAVLPALAGSWLIRTNARRLLLPGRNVRGGPWAARWMSAREASGLARTKGGLPLGYLGRKLLRHRPDPDRGWRGGHHFVVAGTRAGKGVGCVLPAILDHDGPVVVLDLKGELFATTRRWRQSLGRRVVVLNPLGVVEPARDRFNPMDYVRPDHISRDATVLADGLVRPESGDGAHFADLARRLIAAAIEVVARIAPAEERTLVRVADMLLSGDVVATLEEWCEAPSAVGLFAVQAAETILKAGENERGAILTTVDKALGWCAGDHMREFLSISDWSLDELLDGRVDLFVVTPLDQVRELATFMRLIVNICLGTVVRQDGRRVLVKPLLLVLDEFCRLGRMEKLIDVATVAAGSGVEAMMVAQDRAQVESVYGVNDAHTLLAACATVRAFGLGRTDIASAQWLAGALGDRTVQTRGQRLVSNDLGSGSEQRASLAAVDELLELPTDQLIALFPARPPLKLRRIVSHRDRSYRSKLDPNPTLRS